MVATCAAFNCTNRRKKDSGISFHTFPLQKPQLLAKWLSAVKRKDFVPSHHQKLCSVHFSESCFWKSNGNRLLKDEAVPSLFNFRSHRKKKVPMVEKPSRKILKRMTEPTNSNETNEVHVVDDSFIDEEGLHSSMEGEILCKPEAVWLLEDENVLTLIKEEPESDTVSDSEGASFDLKPVKREFCEGEAEEDEPEDESAHTPDSGQDVCSKLEIEDNNILEDSSGCNSPGLGGLQVWHKGAESSVEAADHSEPDIEIPVQKESYNCHFCNVGFSRVLDLVLHTRKSHTGAKPFMCEHCKECFKQRSYLDVHIRTHRGETPFSCEYCSKYFTQRCGLIVHRRTHMKDAPFSCEYCSKCFIRRSVLIEHRRTHTGEIPFTCEYCSKCFTRRSALIVHRWTHTEEKPFSCEYCSKCFAQRSALIYHIRLHTGEKPYSCNHCNKCFAHGSTLVVHRRMHTGEKPYSCDHCNKCFTHGSALVAHRRMHTGEKPFSCDNCSKCFTQRSTLKNHLRTHRGE